MWQLWGCVALVVPGPAGCDDDLEQRYISDEDVYEEIAMIPNTCAAETLYVCLASSQECWASRSGTRGQRLPCLAAVRVLLGDENTCWTPMFCWK